MVSEIDICQEKRHRITIHYYQNSIVPFFLVNFAEEIWINSDMLMKKKCLRIGLLTAFLLMSVLSPVWSTNYKLVKVTSVQAGKMYVFEQDGHVMSNTITDGALETTDTYNTSNLTGTESYVWTLESSGDYYKLKNLSKNDKQYLNNANSSTSLSFSTNGAKWSFSFQEDGTALVQNKETNSNNRFLAYIYIAATNELIYSYKSWANSYLSTDNYHSITVYELVATSEDVTITSAGMATYASDHALDFSGMEGLKAYKAKVVNGNSITFTSVEQVPAGEGVLLKATSTLTESTTFAVPVATESVATWAADDNDFVRGTGGNVPSEDNGIYNYILNNGTSGLGFYKANNKKVATNRAYLSTSTAPSSPAMAMSFDDAATGIRSIDNGQWTMDNEFYNLNGQRVIQPTRGLYIVNGKKVVVK